MLNNRYELDDENLSNVNGGMSESVACQIIEIENQIYASPSRYPTNEQLQQLKNLLEQARCGAETSIEKCTGKNIAIAWQILSKYF